MSGPKLLPCRCEHAKGYHEQTGYAGMCAVPRCPCTDYRPDITKGTKDDTKRVQGTKRVHESGNKNLVSSPQSMNRGQKVSTAGTETVHASKSEATARKTCAACHAELPITEFHQIGNGRRRPKCRDCYTPGRGKRVTTYALIKARARARALAELAKRHQDEYRELLLVAMRNAKQEADELAMATYTDADAEKNPEPSRLKRGMQRRNADVSLEDRIDTTPRCTACGDYHDADHTCDNCGAPAHSAEGGAA